ncbi:MAG: hypothetical protein DRJ07_03115 [Bacteroidetes bacterium]|nr:MAG: hypothetical protein DRJ07_03115 [Bacteroidota bacterium]
MKLIYNEKTKNLKAVKIGECQLSSISTKIAKNLIINMSTEYFKVIAPKQNMIRNYVNGMNLLFAGYLTPEDILDIIEHLIAYYDE